LETPPGTARKPVCRGALGGCEHGKFGPTRPRRATTATVTLHNLSAEPAKVRLPDDTQDPGHGQRMRQTLGDTDPPYSPGQEITLGRYGFRWLRQTD
jgi:hypothetical protein